MDMCRLAISCSRHPIRTSQLLRLGRWDAYYSPSVGRAPYIHCLVLKAGSLPKIWDFKPLLMIVCRLKELPACVFVGVLGVLVDTPAISLVALCKSPVMLFKGWGRLFRDLVGRHGPCLEAACVPFAGLALVLWPLVVGAAFLTAVFCSPFLGLFGAVVVYQVCSFPSFSRPVDIRSKSCSGQAE